MNATESIVRPERSATGSEQPPFPMVDDTGGGLVAALAAAALEFETVTTDATNPHFGSRYATLGALIAATRPALSAHGLAVTQTMEPDAGGGVVLLTTLRHTSGATLASRYPLPAWKGPQDAGSVLTYLRRYSYAALLNIASEHDDDGEGAEIVATASRAFAKAPASRPATSGRSRQGAPQKRTQRDLAASSGELIDAGQLADAIDNTLSLAQLDALVPSLSALPAEARPPLRVRFSERRKALEELANDSRELMALGNEEKTP